MKKGFTIRLFPTAKQDILMRKHIGSQRYIYNWALALNNDLYKQKQKKYSIAELGKMLTQYKKKGEVKWLNEISNATLKEALRNLDKAYTNFYKKRSSLPKFKSKKCSNATFYSRYDKLKFYPKTVNLEKIGKVIFKSNYKIDFTKVTKFSNPTVTWNGRCWVLNFTMEVEPTTNKLEDKILAIDLGIKQLAIVNIEGLDIPNINKTRAVKTLEKKLKRLQRQCSRKYEMNKKGVCYQKTKNIAKLELRIKKLHRKLKNIRNNHIHKATNKMVKAKPKMIVMEDLKVSNMMKNRHLAKAIQQQGFYKFIEQMKYKTALNNIKFIQAPTFYPSSKMCSQCGSIKKDLKLRDRTYKCSVCNFTADRDKNASYNLANYGLSLSL